MNEGPHVYRAMIAVKRKLAAIGLSKTNSAPAAAGGFKFRGIDDLYNVVSGLEADEGLIVLPRIVAERTEYQTNNSGKPQTHVHLTMELKFVSSVDGSSDIASALGEGIDTSDKASGKAQSNAMKQAHLEVYKVPTEGDNDIEGHAEQVGPKLTPKRADEPSAAEQALTAMFKSAKTADEIATAEADAHRAIAAKKIHNGGRERLLTLRAEAIARVAG